MNRLSKELISQIAKDLERHELEHTSRDPFTDEFVDLSLDDAYRIQDFGLELREARGEVYIGQKLGLTSRAKQIRMGVSDPFIAHLTDVMSLPIGQPINMNQFNQPRAEPEIAFVLGSDLKGPGITPAIALHSVATVHAAVEIIDSRYRDFRFKAPDVIADNASSAAFLLNPLGFSVRELDLELQSVLLEINGQVVDSATGAEVMGNPLVALSFAANALNKRGRHLRAGDVVLTGGMTDAYPVIDQQTMVFDFGRLGQISITGETDATD